MRFNRVMIKKFWILLVLFPFVIHATPGNKYISAERKPNESFQQALQRVEHDVFHNRQLLVPLERTPKSNKVPVSKIDFSNVPQVATYKDLLKVFYLIRDSRYLYTRDDPDYARRISWLFPDNGCYARAAAAVLKMNAENLAPARKLFAFGMLSVDTPYSPKGYVSWWYHVALVIAVRGQPFVLDPAINAERPLLVDEWFTVMGDKNIEGTVCNANTYSPYDDCFTDTNSNEEEVLYDEGRFLNREWDRLVSLDLNPMVLLGDYPPWTPAVEQ